MPRVLVVYHLLPHYRRDVFRELESTEGWEFHFAAGASSRDPGIATMAATDLRHVHVLDNVWLGPFLWQRGLFRLLRQPWDHVILLGDVAYLSTWVAAAERRARRKRVAFWTIGWHRPESGLRRRIRLTFYSLADQLLLYGLTPFIGAVCQAQGKAGVVIQQGERMTAATTKGKVSLKIHLPEAIGRIMFEPP